MQRRRKYSPHQYALEIDVAIGVLLDTYGAGLDLEDHSRVLWTLIHATCEARGIKPPKRLPESGHDWNLRVLRSAKATSKKDDAR